MVCDPITGEPLDSTPVAIAAGVGGGLEEGKNAGQKESYSKWIEQKVCYFIYSYSYSYLYLYLYLYFFPLSLSHSFINMHILRYSILKMYNCFLYF